VTASKVTVLPVPASGRARGEEPDPRALVAENERLRAENALLRERLANVQAIALEREQRIEDLKHALRMLPSVWARKLEARLGAASQEPAQTPDLSPASPAPPPLEVEPAVAIEAPGTAEVSMAPEPATVDQQPPRDRAEIMLKEVAALRARLELRRLEVEREMLEQERSKIQADLAWTRKWRRFRGAGSAAP